MGRLTTHVLDTSAGHPAEGMRIELFRIGGERCLLCEMVTNQDGRLDSPLLKDDDFVIGEYELLFHAGEYFSRHHQSVQSPGFLDRVVIRFYVSEPSEHYHVPLLLSPFGYTTYRGS